MAETAAFPRTFFNRVALPVFSWGLPFHSLLVAMLFGGLGLMMLFVLVQAVYLNKHIKPGTAP